MTETKIEFLKTMHSIIINKVNDEDDIMIWLTYAVPDEPTEEDFKFIAEDDELWCDCCRIFGKIVSRA